jgi:hypothetical protein
LYSTDSTTDDEDKRIAGVFHSPFTIHHSPLFFTFMDKILEQPQQNGVEAETQLYLLRINQLYTNIQNWLQDEPLVLENGEIEVIEALGQYQAPGLSIKTL